jgi:hypothetical protein
VKCFKDHECHEIQPETFVIDTNPSASGEVDEIDQNSDILLDVPEKFIIPEDKLKLLSESEDLKTLLGNPHLRDFLKFAHGTHHPLGIVGSYSYNLVFDVSKIIVVNKSSVK